MSPMVVRLIVSEIWRLMKEYLGGMMKKKYHKQKGF